MAELRPFRVFPWVISTGTGWRGPLFSLPKAVKDMNPRLVADGPPVLWKSWSENEWREKIKSPLVPGPSQPHSFFLWRIHFPLSSGVGCCLLQPKLSWQRYLLPGIIVPLKKNSSSSVFLLLDQGFLLGLLSAESFSKMKFNHFYQHTQLE